MTGIGTGDKAFLKIPISEVTGFGLELPDALMVMAYPVLVRLIEDHGFGKVAFVKSLKRPFGMWIELGRLERLE